MCLDINLFLVRITPAFVDFYHLEKKWAWLFQGELFSKLWVWGNQGEWEEKTGWLFWLRGRAGHFLSDYHLWMVLLLLCRRVHQVHGQEHRVGLEEELYLQWGAPHPSLGWPARYWIQTLPLPGAEVALNPDLLKTPQPGTPPEQGFSPAKAPFMPPFLPYNQKLYCSCWVVSLLPLRAKGNHKKIFSPLLTCTSKQLALRWVTALQEAQLVLFSK